jgi:hypothetical protein
MNVLQCKEVISIRVYCKCTIVHRVTSYTIKLAFTLFSRIFTGEGTIGYMGCNSTEHRGRGLEQRP